MRAIITPAAYFMLLDAPVESGDLLKVQRKLHLKLGKHYRETRSIRVAITAEEADYIKSVVPYWDGLYRED